MLSKEELCQHTFVKRCQENYREMGLEPGNPRDGEWQKAHYPLPRALGGTAMIELLVEHHAIQGVLQSEELGTDCIWGWEAKFLDGELLALHKKWMAFKGAKVGHTNAGKPSASWETRKKNWGAVSAAGGRASVAARRERGEQVGAPQNLTDEGRAKGGKAVSATLYECPHCGMKANAGNITRHMRKQGLDPTTKVRLS